MCLFLHCAAVPVSMMLETSPAQPPAITTPPSLYLPVAAASPSNLPPVAATPPSFPLPAAATPSSPSVQLLAAAALPEGPARPAYHKPPAVLRHGPSELLRGWTYHKAVIRSLAGHQNCYATAARPVAGRSSCFPAVTVHRAGCQNCGRTVVDFFSFLGTVLTPLLDVRSDFETVGIRGSVC